MSAAQAGLAGVIAKRAANWNLDGADARLMPAQAPFWNLVIDHYFRLEMEGWDRVAPWSGGEREGGAGRPAEPSLLVGVHSGGALTMDAWTVALQWHRRFGAERTLHPTAHDVLMAAPGLGDYFRAMGTITPSAEAMSEALEGGNDVLLWP